MISNVYGLPVHNLHGCIFFIVTLTWSHINHSGGGHLLAIANKNFVAMVKPKKQTLAKRLSNAHITYIFITSWALSFAHIYSKK